MLQRYGKVRNTKTDVSLAAENKTINQQAVGGRDIEASVTMAHRVGCGLLPGVSLSRWKSCDVAEPFSIQFRQDRRSFNPRDVAGDL